jgi:hypothetical protein
MARPCATQVLQVVHSLRRPPDTTLVRTPLCGAVATEHGALSGHHASIAHGSDGHLVVSEVQRFRGSRRAGAQQRCCRLATCCLCLLRIWVDLDHLHAPPRVVRLALEAAGCPPATPAISARTKVLSPTTITGDAVAVADGVPRTSATGAASLSSAHPALEHHNATAAPESMPAALQCIAATTMSGASSPGDASTQQAVASSPSETPPYRQRLHNQTVAHDSEQPGPCVLGTAMAHIHQHAAAPVCRRKLRHSQARFMRCRSWAARGVGHPPSYLDGESLALVAHHMQRHLRQPGPQHPQGGQLPHVQ